MRRAEIGFAHRAIVVEQPVVRQAIAARDIERDDLVERIAGLGIEAAWVDRVELETPAGSVERAGLVAKAMMLFASASRHEMSAGIRVARQKIGLGRSIAGERPGVAGSCQSIPSGLRRTRAVNAFVVMVTQFSP